MIEKITEQYTFLSHLCGEEGKRSSLRGVSRFLSHLCGEEAYRR